MATLPPAKYPAPADTLIKSLPSDDYQTQDDTRTLQRAHEIISTPKRHAAVRRHLRSQTAAIKSLSSVRPSKALAVKRLRGAR